MARNYFMTGGSKINFNSPSQFNNHNGSMFDNICLCGYVQKKSRPRHRWLSASTLATKIYNYVTVSKDDTTHAIKVRPSRDTKICSRWSNLKRCERYTSIVSGQRLLSTSIFRSRAYICLSLSSSSLTVHEIYANFCIFYQKLVQIYCKFC